jgi:hypothetical protein
MTTEEGRHGSTGRIGLLVAALLCFAAGALGQTVSNLTLSPGTVVGGLANSTGTVTLSAAAPAGGAVVTLSSNNAAATVPANVTVAAGTTSKTFTVTTATVTANQTATITATYNASSRTANLTVRPLLASVAVSPTNPIGGNPSTGTVTLNAAAPAGGAVVTLASNNAAAVVPASVTVSAGSTSATFAITTTVVTANQTATITASNAGNVRTVNLTVRPLLLSVAVNPTSLVGGGNSTGTVTLNAAAPAGGAVITLSSNNAAAAVPASVTVAAAATTATFAVTTTVVTANQTATITASHAGANRTASLTVQPLLASLALSQTSVVGGFGVTGTVALNAAAPAGGASIALTSSVTTRATVPPTVTIPAGSTLGTFLVTTLSVTAAGNTTITASNAGNSRTATLAVRPAPAAYSVTLDPNNVFGGSGATGTVTLDGVPSSATTVTLTSNNAAAVVPATATVSAGTSTATFAITTTTVAASTSVTITAAAGGVSKTATLTVVPTLTSYSVTLNPASVVSAGTSTATVRLNGPAPAGGATVTLSSSATTRATVPANVVVPQGATSANFTVTAKTVTAVGTANINAVYGGVTKTATITVTPTSRIRAVTFAPPAVTGGTSSTATLTLNGPAPAGGAVVTLSSSNTAAATVPPSATVAAAASSVNVTVSTVRTDQSVNAVITATYGGVSITGTLTVLAAVPTSLGLSPTSVIGGAANSTATITLTGPAAVGGAVVALSSSNTAAATVPTTVTVANNATSATFTVTTLAVASTTSVTITATRQGVTRTATLTVNPSASTGLSSVTLSPATVVGGNNSTGTVTLTAGAPAGGAVVSLTSSNTSAATVPANVTVAAGATTATFTVTTLGVAANTSSVITATFASVNRTATLTVQRAGISTVSVSPTTASAGAAVTGTATLNGKAPPAGAVVTLSSSNTNAATVPANLTVPSGATQATFPVTVKSVVSTTTVTITATLLTSTTTTLTVTPCSVATAPPPGSFPAGDVVWFEDALPAGVSTDQTWSWDTTQKASGTASHTQPAVSGVHYQSFGGWAGPYVRNGDRLVVYVLLNPCNPPTEVMIQWESNEGFEHRAYWGADSIPWGTNGTPSRAPMGALPATGQWIRLEVPAATVGLGGKTIFGVTYVLHNGQAWFDRTGSNASFCVPPIAATPTIPPGDVVWFDEAIPAGASPSGTWVWDTTQKVSGTKSHTEPGQSWIHSHSFVDGFPGITVSPGDALVLWMLVNSCDPPREIIVEWGHSGDWEHRAYWGQNLIDYIGVDGTASRWHMGAIPTAGEWVRLVVPAADVGLEGFQVTDISFYLVDGQVWWDRPGKATSGPSLVSLSVSQPGVLGGSPATGTVTLSSAAPSGGLVVSLGTSNPGTANVPSTVTVLEGLASASFQITTTAVASITTVTLSATLDGQTRNATLEVESPGSLTSVSVSPTLIAPAATATGTVTLNSPAAAGGAPVTLSASPAGIVTVPASVTVPQNAGSATFTVTGQAAGTATITASRGVRNRTAGISVQVGGGVPTGDLAENNSATWGSFADDAAATSLADDSTRVLMGAASIRFTTASGASTGVRLPATPSAHWDLRTRPFLSIGYWAENPLGFAGAPIVTLRTATGSIEYIPTTWNLSSGSWRRFQIALEGDTFWTRSVTGTPDFSDVQQIELKVDSWGTGFTMWFDAVEFLAALPGDWSEGSSSNWAAYAVDSATTTVSSDTTRVKVGANSIKMITASGYETVLKYPATGVLDWGVSGATHLSFWLYAENANGAFQGPQPTVVFRSGAGSLTYTPIGTLMTIGAWRLYQIALDGSSLWTRTDENGATLAVVDAIEWHFDTWGTGFTIYLDGFTFGSATAPVGLRLEKMSVSPLSVLAGSPATGTATLSGPAPGGGAHVTLTASHLGILTMPASITVPAGSSSYNFTIGTSAASPHPGVTITGTYLGLQQSTTLPVVATGGPTLQGVTLSPSTIVSGEWGLGLVTLSGPSPASGASVLLTSSDPALCAVPSVVLVPAGAATASFPFSTAASASGGTVTVTGTYASVQRTATLNVQGSPIGSISVLPLSLKRSGSASAVVNLTTAAPVGGLVVTLAGIGPITVPPSVTVPAGATSAGFTVNASATGFGRATITATAGGVTRQTGLDVYAGPYPAGELGEAGSTLWSAVSPTGAATSLSSDGLNVSAGESSLRISASSSAVDLVYPVGGGADWDLTVVNVVSFWARASATGGAPALTLRTPGGSVRYQAPAGLAVDPGWREYQVALRGIGYWTKAVTGTPDLAHVGQVEIQQLPAGAGVEAWVDGLRFLRNVPDDANEFNASSWGSVYAGATFSDSSVLSRVGTTSTTSNGFDFSFPGDASGDWDLTGADQISFWAMLRASHDGAYEGGGPLVTLFATGGTARYERVGEAPPLNVWTLFHVPVAGGGGWTRTNTLTPDLAHVQKVQIQFPGHAGTRFFIDGLTFGATAAGLHVDELRLRTGTAATGVVALGSPAPPGGINVALSSSNPAAAALPASVFLAEGAIEASFPVVAGAVGAPTTVTLLATYGLTNWSRDISIVPGALPTASLTAPAAGASIGNPGTVAMTANAASDLGPLDRVEFRVDGNFVGASYEPPYAYTWKNARPASYSLTARAIDREGRATTSAARTFSVTGTSAAASGLLGEYFQTISLTDLRIARTELLDFAWGSAAPDPVLTGGWFSARWTGHVLPAFTESHTFYLTVEGGARLWLDGQLLIDVWSAGGAGTSAPVALTANKLYRLLVEYRDHLATAAIRLEWSSPSQPRQVVPSARVFSPQPPLLLTGLGLSPATVNEGSSTTGTVTLSGTAATATTVNLSNVPSWGTVTIPPTVVVPQGQSTATFTATANEGSGSPARILASLGSTSRTADLTINQGAISNIYCGCDGSIVGSPGDGNGLEMYLSVSLTANAPAGGATIAIGSFNPSIVVVSPSVTIPAGTTSGTTLVRIKQVASPTPAWVSFTYGGDTDRWNFTIEPLVIETFGFPATVAGDSTLDGFVYLNGKARVDVSLTSSSPSVASIPATVRTDTPNPFGNGEARPRITTFAVRNDTPVTFTATYNGVSKQDTVTVLGAPPAMKTFTVTPVTISGTTGSATGTVGFNLPADPGGTLVSLASDSPSVVVPANVLVPQGSMTGTVPISIPDIRGFRHAIVTASTSAGVTKQVMVTRIVPILKLPGSGGSTIPYLQFAPMAMSATIDTLDNQPVNVYWLLTDGLGETILTIPFTDRESRLRGREGQVRVIATVAGSPMPNIDHPTDPCNGAMPGSCGWASAIVTSTASCSSTAGPYPGGVLVNGVQDFVTGSPPTLTTSVGGRFRWVLEKQSAPGVWDPVATNADAGTWGDGFGSSSSWVPRKAGGVDLEAGSYRIQLLAGVSGTYPPPCFQNTGSSAIHYFNVLGSGPKLLGVAPGVALPGDSINAYAQNLGTSPVLELRGPVYSLTNTTTPLCNESSGACPVLLPLAGPIVDGLTFNVPLGATPGYYAVRIRNSGGNLSSPIWLVVENGLRGQSVLSAEQHSLASRLFPGQTVDGAFAASGDPSGEYGDFNDFFFVATAGSTLTAALERTDTSLSWQNPASLDPEIEIIAPDGVVYQNLYSRDRVPESDLNASLTGAVLPLTGVYFLRASTSKGSGPYRLTFGMTMAAAPAAVRTIPLNGNYTTLKGGESISINAFSIDRRGHPLSGSAVTYAPVPGGDNRAILNFQSSTRTTTWPDGASVVSLYLLGQGMAGIDLTIDEPLLASVTADEADPLTASATSEGPAPAPPRYRPVATGAIRARALYEDGTLLVERAPLERHAIWAPRGQEETQGARRASAGLFAESKSLPVSGPAGWSGVRADALTATPLAADATVISGCQDDRQDFTLATAFWSNPARPYSLVLTDLTPSTGQSDPNGEIGPEGIHGHRVEKEIRVRIDIKDANGSMVDHPVLVHLELGGHGADISKLGRLILDPEGARIECTSATFVWHEENAQGQIIAFNDEIKYRLGKHAPYVGAIADPDNPGSVKAVWGLGEVLSAEIRIEDFGSVIDASARAIGVHIEPGKPDHFVFLSELLTPPVSAIQRYWADYPLDYISGQRRDMDEISRTNVLFLTDVHGNATFGYRQMTPAAPAPHAKMTAEFFEQTQGVQNAHAFDFNGYGLTLDWYGDPDPPSGSLQTTISVTYPSDPEWSAGGVVSKVVPIELYRTTNAAPLRWLQSLHVDEYDLECAVLGQDYAADPQPPFIVSPKASGAGLPRVIGAQSSPQFQNTAARRNFVIKTASLRQDEPANCNALTTGHLCTPNEPLRDKLEIQDNPAFKISLIDKDLKVVEDAAFQVHRCPRCKHNPHNPAAVCSLPVVTSQNGVVDSVRVNPNGLNGADSEGYLGVELVVAPGNPGSYFLKFETLEGKQYQVRQHADITTDYATPTGQYQGAFRFITVAGGEFLDSSYRRINGAMVVREPTLLYLRYRNASGIGPATAELTSTREGATVVQDNVSLPMNRIGTTQEYMGVFTALPEGYSDSVGGTSIRVSVARGELSATQAIATLARTSLKATTSNNGDLLAVAPTRSPIPASIQEVGFKGDYLITLWNPDLPEDQHIRVDYPDGSLPTWKLTGNPNQPVAYKVGTKPTIFGVLHVTPPLPAPVEAVIRVFRGTELVASQPITVPVGGIVPVQNIQSQLVFELATRKTTPTLSWELCLDDTSSCFSVGISGPHTMYWTLDAPKLPVFETQANSEFSQLYDFALSKAFEGIGLGANDPQIPVSEIALRIAVQIDDDIHYDPGDGIGDTTHPLKIFDHGSVQCAEAAEALSGLLRSIGILGTTKYFWSGSAIRLHTFNSPGGPYTTFQVLEALEGEAQPDPHFVFHAMTQADGGFYDPSYGKVRPGLSFVESVCINEQAGTFTVHHNNACQQISGVYIGVPRESGWNCDHLDD